MGRKAQPRRRSNVRADGTLEVMIGEDAAENVVVSLTFVESGSTFGATSKRLDRKFVHSPGSFACGHQAKEWEEVTLLMAGGKTGASSMIDDPENIEKVILRLTRGQVEHAESG